MADALLARAAPDDGARVLDIGCGCGVTTLAAARAVGDTGSACGIDLSAPMLDVARRRARAAGADNATFVQSDAQTYRFAPASIDLVLSRFGTMFFSDPDAAFTNIAASVLPEGRLCLATWQPLAANDWLTVPGAALLQHTDLPDTAADGPGMFAQSDPAIITATLSAAGFTDLAIDSTSVMLTLGTTLDQAVEYLADSGPGRALLETIPDGPARDAALVDVREALVEHRDDTGVRLGGRIWLVSATR